MKSKKTKTLTFKDVYGRPFSLLFLNIGIQSSTNVRALDFLCKVSDEDKQRIVDLLNGKSDNPIAGSLSIKNGGDIYIKDMPLLRVRGWGHLTGCGGLHLNPDFAADIQNDFAKWVVSTLTLEN